jgi:hypothetical protein
MQGDIAEKQMLVHPESSIVLSFIYANDVGGVQSKVKSNLSNL